MRHVFRGPARACLSTAIAIQLVTTLGCTKFKGGASSSGADTTQQQSQQQTASLGAPTNLSLSLASATSIALTWTDQSTDEQGFKIERSTDNVTYSAVGQTGANVTTYTDSNGILLNTSYYYRVFAFNASGNSAESNTVMTTTPASSGTPPAAPSGLTATAIASNKVVLKWTDNSGSEDAVLVERLDPGATTFQQIKSLPANTVTYEDWPVTAGVTYRYRVRVQAGTLYSGFSNEYPATTPSADTLNGPTNLRGSVLSGSAVHLDWNDNSTNEDGYYVYTSTDGGKTFGQTQKTGPGVAGIRIDALTASQPVSFKVTAFIGAHESTAAGPITLTPSAGGDPMPAPTLGTPAAVGATEIDLYWLDNTGDEDGFQIERRTDTTPYALIKTTMANVNYFKDTGLTSSTKYYYRMRAYQGASRLSPYSSPEQSATTLASATDIAAPTDLTATASSTAASVTLNWTSNSSNQTGFHVERAMADGPFSVVGTVAANVTTYPDPGLQPSTLYHYRVQAFNDTNASQYSNTADATTPNVAAAPAKPTGLTATATAPNSVSLAWTDNAGTTATGYNVYRRPTGSGSFTQLTQLPPKSAAYVDGSVASATAYDYQVGAYNAAGETLSDPASATTPAPIMTPPSPTNLRGATVTTTQILLTWQVNSTTELGFRVERAVGTGAYAPLTTLAAGTSTTTDTGVIANSAYKYRVRAYNSYGDSVASTNEIAIFTPTEPPPAVPNSPSGVFANALADGTAEVLWVDNAVGEDGFRVTRTDPTGAVVNVDIPTADTTRYVDTTVAADTAYRYVVKASKAGVFSELSNDIVITTAQSNAPLSAPTGLTGKVLSATSVELDWTDANTKKSGTHIEMATGTGAFTRIDTVGVSALTYPANSLTPDTDYSFQVKAFNLAGDSAPSNSVKVHTPKIPPAKPTAVTATAAANGGFTITWTAGSSNQEGFKLQRAINGAGFTDLTAVAATVLTYSDNAVDLASTYVYQVAAFNSAGISDYAASASVKPAQTAPAAPSNLAGTAMSDTRIDLTWTRNSANEGSFEIQMKSGAGTFSTVATPPQGSTSFSITSGLVQQTAYTFQIRALNTAGPSAYVQSPAITTKQAVPATPANFKATVTAGAVGQTKIVLTWTASATAATYRIERSVSGGAFTVLTVPPLAASILTLEDAGLTPDTAYSYNLYATDNGGDSAPANATARTNKLAPGTPTNFAVTGFTSSSVSLAWTAVASADYYIIQRTGASTASIQVPGNQATYTDPAPPGVLAANSTFSYQIKATNNGGESAFSAAVSATTNKNPPAAPGSLTAKASTTLSTKISLAWTGVVNADGYKVMRKTATVAYAVVGNTLPGVVTFDDTTAAPSTTYTYEIIAFDNGGDGAPSNEATATTIGAPPAAPTNLAATAVAAKQVNLTWVDHDQAPLAATSYRVLRRTGTAAFATIATLPPGATAYSDADPVLVANTAYDYQVIADRTGSESSAPAQVSTTTLNNPPAAPSGITGTATDADQITVKWTDNATNEAGFKLERSTDGTTYTQITTTGAGVATFPDTGLAELTAYYYRVRAFNNGGNSAFNTMTTPVRTLIQAPTNLKAATVSATAVDLTFAYAGTLNDAGFKIERAAGAGAFAQIAIVAQGATTYHDTALAAFTAYHYRIRATRSATPASDSIFTATADATTLHNAPPAPSALVLTVLTSTSIKLAWTDNSNTVQNQEANFRIERSQGDDQHYAFLANTTTGVVTFTDTTVAQNTLYFYRVRAENDGGNSAFLTEQSTTTFMDTPAAPSFPTTNAAVGINESSITLTWIDNSNNEDGFKVERAPSVAGVPGTFAAITTGGCSGTQLANSTSCTDTGLATLTHYFYRVRAVNDNPVTSVSGSVEGATLIPTPNLTAATAVQNGVQLTWTYANTALDDGFLILRATAGGAFVQISTVGKDELTFLDATAATGTSYTYEIQAYSLTNLNSAVSNMKNVTP